MNETIQYCHCQYLMMFFIFAFVYLFTYLFDLEDEDSEGLKY